MIILYQKNIKQILILKWKQIENSKMKLIDIALIGQVGVNSQKKELIKLTNVE